MQPTGKNGAFSGTAVVPEPPGYNSEEINHPGKVVEMNAPPLLPSGDDRATPPGSRPPELPSQVGRDEEMRTQKTTESRPSMLVGQSMTRKSKSEHAEKDAHGSDGHSHEKPLSIVNAAASGVINYLLMFGLCCAFGMILFENDWNAQHRALGVKLNLLTALIVGLLLACKSKICVAIGGPDLTPVVFLGGFVNIIAEDIAKQVGLEYPATGDGRRLWTEDRYDYEEFARRLAGGGGASADAEFCSGSHLTADNEAACADYHAQLTATVVFAIMVSSICLGVLFFCLGRFKLSRYVSYVPTSIMEAFLSCVGYKVFKYALTFCQNEPQQFIFAACVGVPLYFVKAMHLGNPALVIPAMLFAPLICFYIWIFGVRGEDLDKAREDQWMFPKIDNVNFWELWTEGVYGSMGNVNTKAWAKTIPDLLMMIVVCLLDCLLKLSSTETKLPISVEKDYEIQIVGLGNFVTTVCGASVGYMQLKFNVVNYGVMGNTKDRRGGAIYALLCGVGFFWSMESINYLPRFFLGILLFFAGAGFVAENLWGSRKYLSFHEWMQIFVILAVFIFSGKLLWAVLAGGLLTGMDFIVRYSRVPCTSGNPMRGGEIVSKERYGPILQRNLQHIANNWLLVVKLKGFVFFASAQRLTKYVRDEIMKQAGVPEYRQLKFIAFDCHLLDGMDASASKAMKKLVLEARTEHIRILWSHVTEKFVEELKSRKILEGDWNAFKNLDEVKSYVEDKAYIYLSEKQLRWVDLHPAFRLRHELMRMQHAFEPFEQIFVVDAVRRGCPWQYCGALQMKAYETRLWMPGERNQDLFLVHSGAVGIFKEVPSEDDLIQPDAIYRHGWFINRNQLIRAPTRNWAVSIQDGEVLFWNEQQWARMARECPFMCSAMSKLVMKQQVLDSDLDARVNPVNDLPLLDEDAIQDPEPPRHSASMFVASTNIRPSNVTDQRESSVDDARSLACCETESGDVGSRHEAGCAKAQSGASSLAPLQAPPTNSTSGGGPRASFMQQLFHLGTGSVGAKRVSGTSENLGEIVEENTKKGGRRPSGLMANVLPWLVQDGSADEVSKFKEVRSAVSLTIPEQLQARIEGIQTAQVMDKYRLYDSVAGSETCLPWLPRSFRMDLEIAFYTYAKIDSGSSTAYLPTRLFPQALMYAGIFNTLVKPGHLASVKPESERLNLQEFLQLGHEAVMARLSSTQEEKIDEIFKQYDDDQSGELSRDELVGMFRHMFHPDISIEEVDGIANAWDDECCGRINFESFKAIMSHLIKEHEQDWVLLNGFRDILGIPSTHEISHDDMISVEGLVSNCKCFPPITEDEAEELLWVADWRQHGLGEGKTLGFADVVAAVVLDINMPRGCTLPPRPKIPEAARRRTMIANRVNPEKLMNESKGFSSKKRDAIHGKHVVDVRDMALSFQVLSETMQELSMDNLKGVSTKRLPNLVTKHEERAHPTLNHEAHNFDSPLLKTHNDQDALGIRGKIYLFLEEPKSSLYANYFSLLMGLMIIVSVLTLVLEPLTTQDGESKLEKEVWRGFEIYFTALFTMELLIRLAVADSLGTQTMSGFCKAPSNICDFVSVLPFYIEIAVSGGGDSDSAGGDEFRLLRIARLMRLSRVIKIAKLANRSSLFGPVAMVLTVIWGIYLKNDDGSK